MERKGFTLIEILIVVAIIAILASVVIVGLGPAQRSGRDARRLADLQQIENGLALYDNKCGHFPGASDCTGAGTTGGYAGATGIATILPATAGLGINSVPNDPQTGKRYYYATNAVGTSFMLMAQLEDTNNAAFSNYTAPSPSSYGQGDNISNCIAPNYCITL